MTPAPAAHLKERVPRRAERARGSARLGLQLRSVLAAPRAGFEAVVAAADERAARGYRSPEGFAPAVLAALGGAGLLSVWLKLGGLVGLRRFASADFEWTYLIVWVVLAAVLALAVQPLWSLLVAWAAPALGGRARTRDLRIAWGSASLPLVFALVLVPLDLLIVGPEIFATDRLAGPVSTAWTALSIALGISAVVWWVYLLVRGVQVVARLTWLRALVSLLLCFSALGIVVFVVRTGAVALDRWLT